MRWTADRVASDSRYKLVGGFGGIGDADGGAGTEGEEGKIEKPMIARQRSMKAEILSRNKLARCNAKYGRWTGYG